MRPRGSGLFFVSCMVLSVCLVPTLAAETARPLDANNMRDQRELDRRFVEAHDQKSTDLLMSTFSESPDVFLIAPHGVLFRGRKGIRDSVDAFFAGLDYIHGKIREVSYVPAGEGVIGVGTVVFNRKPKDRPPEQKTVVWTDYRRREGGRWVYVFRHAHWPLETRP